MRIIFLLLILGTTLSSCFTYVPVKKVLAPELSIPSNRANFIFLSRFNIDSLDFNNENKVEVFKLGHESYLRGLASGFDTSSSFHLTLLDIEIQKDTSFKPGNALDKKTVSQLCAETRMDYLLSLDAFNLFFDKEVEVTVLDDGSKNRRAYYDLVLHVFITVYDKNGDIVNKFLEENRIAHDSRNVLSGLLAIGPSIGRADKNAIFLSDELGRSFIHKLFPYIIYESRRFYNTKEFANAYQAFMRKDFLTAELELYELTKSSNNKTAGRAAYNLAVLYENLNRSSQMDYWYQEASRILGKNLPY